jgi:nitroreductase
MNVTLPDSALWAATLIQSRRTTLPKRLCGPAPDDTQQRLILEAAAAAPDHDQILPWRFVEVPASCRDALGQAFTAALLERDSAATAEDCQQAHDKATRSPWLLLAVVRTAGEPANIPAQERILSAGAAIQNMLLMCSALGLGSSLTSGKAMGSRPLRTLFGLGDEEQALCFINIGHILAPRKERPRPDTRRYCSVLGQPQN